MCGIAGILSLDDQLVYDGELRNMCAAIAHRGPDDEGHYLRPGVGLAMRRLAIIDVEAGNQPVSNEDGTIWLVFNGEIYNFQELRQDLERRGHVFRSHTDTEAIVHLYEEYGKQAVQHLRGMFTFALWDERKRQLIVARDRVGIKPLYYAHHSGRLVFASELKSILRLPEFERQINWKAMAHLFAFLTTPSADSIIEGVHKLEPGHLLTASPHRGIAIERYWNLEFEPDYGRDEQYFVGRLRDLLDESVRLHMISDVPLGAFLSGGIDSSAVVAAASRMTPDPLKTFSIGFAEAEYNELDHARLVAETFHTNHNELTLGPDGHDRLFELAWHLDEPFGDSSAIPTYMVSRMAAQHVKVVLSGDGGDELFGGYERYLVEDRERRRASLPPGVRNVMRRISSSMPDGMRGRNFLRHASLAGSERYLDACTLFKSDDMRKLFRPELLEMIAPHDAWRAKAETIGSGGANWLSGLQLFDMKNYLPLDILTKVDRMSMAHSIETRVPLLDHKLIEFAATVPPELNLRNGTTKYIFKQAMRGILPDRIIDRPKHGFAIPLGYWFRGKLGTYVRELLLGDRNRRRGYFNLPYVEGLLSRHEKGHSLDLEIWTLMSFELWARVFLDREDSKMACEAA